MYTPLGRLWQRRKRPRQMSLPAMGFKMTLIKAKAVLRLICLRMEKLKVKGFCLLVFKDKPNTAKTVSPKPLSRRAI